MFGFVAAFVLITAAYLIIWRISNKRSEAEEAQRRRNLLAANEKTGPTTRDDINTSANTNARDVFVPGDGGDEKRGDGRSGSGSGTYSAAGGY